MKNKIWLAGALGFLFCQIAFGQNPYGGDSLEKYKRMPPQVGVKKMEAAINHPEFKNDSLLVNYLGSILFRYRKSKTPDTLITIPRRMLKAAHRINDTSLINKSLLAHSWVFRDMGQTDSTLYYVQKAEKTAKQVGDTLTRLNALNTLAAVYYDLNNDSLQKLHLLKAEELSRSKSFITQRPIITSNLGYIFLKEENYERAIHFFLESDSLMRIVSPSNYFGFFLSFNHLTDSYEKQSKFGRALQYSDSTRKYAGLTGSKPHIMIAEAHYRVLKIENNETVTKDDFYKELNTFDVIRLPVDERVSLLRFKMKLQGHFGDFRAAYETSRDYAKLRDSLNTADLRDKITTAREAYRANEREKEIMQLEKEKEISNLLSEKRRGQIAALSILLIVVFIAGASLIFYNRKLKKAREELQKLNDTKDQFFAIVSHDLRNATTAFQGLGKIIKKYVSRGNTEKLESLGSKIDSEADNLNVLLDNLLNWSMTQLKAVPSKPERLQLNERTHGIIELFQNHANSKEIELDNQLPEDITAYIDPHAYDLVMRNLVGNSLKFTDRGGKITITGVIENNKVKLQVQDNGKGMNEDKLKKLFNIDEKKSTKGTQGERGSGLGLVLCKEYLELNGGFIRVQSQPGKGTTKTVELQKAA